ncbi:MAG: Rpp14/Pop5 family protein [archaeon]
MREKKRYLVFEVVAKHALNLDEVRRAVNTALLQFLGELGYSKAGVMILDDWRNNKGIMKVSNKHVDDVKAGLALISKVGNEAVIVRTVGVSGILNKARGKFL